MHKKKLNNKEIKALALKVVADCRGLASYSAQSDSSIGLVAGKIAEINTRLGELTDDRQVS